MIRITGGKFRGFLIKEVPDRRTRYTTSMVRQAIFNMIDVKGKTFLELFCGSCAVLIEAISRGASGGSAVDISMRAVKICKENLERLGLLNTVKLYRTDATKFVKSKGESFDVIFLDPPYGLSLVERTMKAMREDLLNDGGIVIIEKWKKESIYIPKFLEMINAKTYGDSEVVILKKP